MGSKRKQVRHQRYGASRPYQTRPTLPVITVVCDDTKTAAAYFTELKREVKAKVTVNVEPAPRCGASADDVLRHAARFAESLRPTQSGDSTWVLLDMEAEAYRQDQALQVKEQAALRPVAVLLSNPCFEVRTLAHLVDTGEAFKGCAAVVARIKAEWKKKLGVDFGNKKSQADYAKLMPLRGEAVIIARKRSPDRDGSWTEVFHVVEAVTRLHTGT